MARARHGEAAARNALWELAAELVRAAVRRTRGLPRLWDHEDLRQEAFVIFAEVCGAWPGPEDAGDAAAYLEREYPRALARHVRRVWRRQRRELSLGDALGEPADPEAEGLYRLAELLDWATRLPGPLRAALVLHLVYGLPLAEVGRQLGLGRRALAGLVARGAALAAAPRAEARIERFVRGLYAYTDSVGNLIAPARTIRAALGLSEGAYREMIAELERGGVLAGRRRGRGGRLPAAGADAAIRLLRERHQPRSA